MQYFTRYFYGPSFGKPDSLVGSERVSKVEEKKGKRIGWCRSYRILGVRFERAAHAEAFFVAYNFADFSGEFSRCKTEMRGF